MSHFNISNLINNKIINPFLTQFNKVKQSPRVIFLLEIIKSGFGYLSSTLYPNRLIRMIHNSPFLMRTAEKIKKISAHRFGFSSKEIKKPISSLVPVKPPPPCHPLPTEEQTKSIDNNFKKKERLEQTPTSSLKNENISTEAVQISSSKLNRAIKALLPYLPQDRNIAMQALVNPIKLAYQLHEIDMPNEELVKTVKLLLLIGKINGKLKEVAAPFWIPINGEYRWHLYMKDRKVCIMSKRELIGTSTKLQALFQTLNNK